MTQSTDCSFNATDYAKGHFVTKRQSTFFVGIIGNCHSINIARVMQAANPFLKVAHFLFINDDTELDTEAERVLSGCDLLVTTDFPGRQTRRLPQADTLIELPGTYFAAFHPDMLSLPVSSVGAYFFGNMQSRIIVECYLRGYSRQKTLETFNQDTYEALGYFNAMEPEIERLTQNYARYNLDLSQFLPGWLRRGCFMYMIYHPRLYVFIDLALDCMRRCQIPIINHVNLEDYVEDKLWGSLTWPVYPAIASSLGMPECGCYVFKYGSVALSLEEFIRLSYKSYKMAGLPLEHIKRIDF